MGIDILTEQQKRTLQTCLMQTFLAAASVLAGYYFSNSILVTVWLMVITFNLMQMWYFVKIYKFLDLSAMEYIRSTLLTLVIVAVGAIVSRFVFVQIASAIHIPFFQYLLSCLA